ncbi:MAG TPA: DUF362 domain-containing protein [Mariniphaga anaerophila]|uniref:DUF362 domain-containing protein n=1 Tax=Mariniphaga anaerophila TaxID=1484053 RepID=A0A831LNP4_9BACT|nr:DUF362 domain-containing protein [Mariniphaga anaerophila]
MTILSEGKSSQKNKPKNIPRRTFVSTVLSGAVSTVVLNNPSTVLAMNYLKEDDLNFLAPEGPNKPMGRGKGIFLGRVAWVHKPEACTWNGTEGFWWEDKWNNQQFISEMFSKTIHTVSGKETDKKAWKAIFTSFNETHGKGKKDYRKGEKIALKVNMNNDRRSYDDTAWINSSPHVVNAVLESLINHAGILPENITVFDSSRYFTPHFYDSIHNAFPKVKMVDGYGGLPGREKALWTPAQVTYANMNRCGTSVATCAIEASYLINMYIAKGHPFSGVTLSGKNHYGTIDGREHAMIKSYNTGYGTYNPIVEVMGHRDMGGKTLLNVCDMLYGCYHSDSIPIKWNMEPFNGHWPSSLLVSQDAVANDSVATDFLTTEFGPRTDIPKGVNTGYKVDMRNCDSVLHEAALADNPPSGSVYAPHGDGIRLQSLGVHEHWNNPKEKLYSRNLGAGEGIELMKC